MIYQSLTFLGLLSSIISTQTTLDTISTNTLQTHTTSTTNTIESKILSKDSTHKELKQYVKNQFQLSGSFTDKITKLSKVQFEVSNNNIDLNKLNEVSNESHLRGLKMKDNFVNYAAYHDEACTIPHYRFGQLLNYCTNEIGEDSGVKRSVIYKANKKENLFVKLFYEGYNCKGVPTKVSSVTSAFPNFEGLDDCFPQEEDGETLYYKFSYITTYPTLDTPGSVVGITYPEDLCSSDNKDYQSYYEVPIEMLGIPLNECVPTGTIWVKYTTSSCSVTGQLSANFYFDSACTNSYTTIPIFDTDCLADDDDSADDDDDDTGDDDDDYVEAKVISNQYCT